MCHRSLSLVRETIEFRLETKAVDFEREIVAIARHEHRLSIEKQASREGVGDHEAIPAREAPLG